MQISLKDVSLREVVGSGLTVCAVEPKPCELLLLDYQIWKPGTEFTIKHLRFSIDDKRTVLIALHHRSGNFLIDQIRRAENMLHVFELTGSVRKLDYSNGEWRMSIAAEYVHVEADNAMLRRAEKFLNKQRVA